jgi:hypothetical protein
MEHLVDPLAFVEETLRHVGANTLIFTTELYEGDVPKPDDWWYYTFATGQHIGFFNRQTLEALANRLGLSFYSANGLHVLSRQPIDPRLFKLASNRWAAQMGSRWIRRHLGSKTLSDHEFILNLSSAKTK